MSRRSVVRSKWTTVTWYAMAVTALVAIAAVIPATAHAAYVPTTRDQMIFERYVVQGQGDYPQAITVSPFGDVYYTHSDYWDGLDASNSVHGVTSEGIEFFNVGASDYSQFMWPDGLALTPDGDLVVADTSETGDGDHNRLRMFDTSTGSLIRNVGGPGTGPLGFNMPYGVAVSDSGHVYVADTGNNRIQIIDAATGSFESMWSVPTTVGTSPDGLAFDPDGNLWVVLTGNNRVAKFSPTGTLLDTIDSWQEVDEQGDPTGTGTFWGPKDVAVDHFGVVYVADTENSRVVRFDSEGGWLATLYGADTPEAAFSYPTDVDCDVFGNLYVADAFNDAVYKMSLVMADPDTVPPVTTSNVTSVWQKGPVNVTLSATDASLSVEATYYSIDGSEPSVLYTGPFQITAEGTTQLQYYSVDTAENSELVKSQDVRIDNTNPAAAISLNQVTYGYETTVTMSATDSLSGVKNIVYILDNGTPKFYTGQFKVMGIGLHFIDYWSVDNAGNVEPFKHAWCSIEAPDANPPVSYSDAPSGWVNQNVSVEITATDDVSGVDDIYYSRDGSNPTVPYTGPLTFNAEGINVLKYHAIDLRGNAETVHTDNIKIDKSVPTASSDAVASYVDSATINFQASDSVSGVLDFVYRFNDGAWQHGYTFNTTQWGNHRVTWYATDQAGNTSSQRTDYFTVLQPDNEPPITGDDIPSSWVRGPVSINFDAHDVISSVAATYYSFDGSYPTNVYDPPLTYNVEGEHEVKFYSEDSRGNKEPVTTKTVRIDNTPPVSTSDVEEFYMGTAHITFTASDSLSSVNYLYYRLDGGTWTQGRSGDVLTTSAIGNHTLEYYAVDTPGNRETTQTANFRLVPPDTEPPVTTMIAPTGWVKGPVQVEFSAYDTTSTITGTYYSLTGGTPISAYTGPITVFAEGTTYITYRSVDEWSNWEDIKSGEVKIDNTAPLTSTDATSSYVDQAIVTFSPSDPLSGAKTTYYKIDGGAWQQGSSAYVTGYYYHTVYYYTVDNAGNVEPTKSATFRINRSDRYYDEDDSLILYRGNWNDINGTGVTNGTTDPNGSVWYYVQADRVWYYADIAPNAGIARLSIDNGPWIDIDLYNGWLRSNEIAWYSGDLEYDYHLIRIEYTGRKNPLSSGYGINLAQARVQGTMYPVPDSQAPVTTSNVNGDWQKGPVSVSLTSTDATTGVASTYYSTDGSNPSLTYSAPVSLTNQGTTVFKFYSVDKRGNAEAVHTEYVKIDNTAPVTTSNAASAYVGAATITLSPTDSHSGVASTFWRVDGGAWQTGLTASVANAPGDHLVEWYSVDALGNTETVKSASVAICTRYEQDASAIVYRGSGWSTAGNAARSGGSWAYTNAAGSSAYFVVQGTGLDLVASTGPTYGIARIVVDGGTPVNADLYSSTNKHQIRVAQIRGLSAGTHRVRIEWTGTKNASSSGTGIGIDAIDSVGTITPDVTAPVSTSDIVEGWRNTSSTVTLSAIDTDSYVASINYRINGGAPTVYSAPFSVTAEGDHTVEFWAVDGAGNAETPTTKHVRIDRTLPAGSHNADSAWQQGPVDVELTATDDRSAVASVLYSTDGSVPHLVYTDAITVSAEGETTIRFSVTDNAGNSVEPASALVRVDNTAPTTGDNAPDEWVGGPVDVTLTPSDARSGVATTTYTIDGGAPQTYTGTFTLSDEGDHTLQYWSIDHADNLESTTTKHVRIDDSAPVTTDDAPAGWVDGPVSVTLEATDTVSGLELTEYRLDGGAWSAYDAPVQISAEGTTTLEYRSVDVKGNSENINSATVRIDDSAPVTTDDAPAGWVDGPVSVTLEATDTVSGLELTEYRLNGGAWSAYDAPVQISAEGTTTLEYRSVDVKGNTEQINTATVRIDDSAPVTTDDAPAGWVDGPVSVTLEATDTVSGLELTEYRLDGGAWSAYDAPVQISAEGTTTLEYRSVDVKGNSENINSATVKIDDSAPVTSDDAPAGWVNGPVSVTLEATDAVSGLELTEYRLDGGAWSAYDAPVQISAEGTTTLEYRSVDVKGNSEQVNSATVTIDDSAPVISDNAAARYFGSATVTLTVSDALSGVADTEYRINGGTWTSGTSLTIPETGIIVLEYRSTDVAGNVSDTTTREFVVVNRTENDAAMVSYTEAWTRNTLAGASGGTYQTTTANNATANISFNGRRIDLIGIKAPFLGIANVIVDGGAQIPVDCYNPTQLNNTVVWSSGELSDGPHTLRVEYTGTKNPAATNTRVSIDAFDIVGSAAMRRYEQDDILAAYYGSWSTNNLASASGTTYQTTIASGSSADIAFNGKRVDLIGIKAPFLGIANVIVDGGAPIPVDCYNTTQLNNTVLWSSGELTDGRHTVRVEYTGTKNPAASNTRVSIDAFDVVGYLTPLRYEQNSAWASYVGTWTENTYSDASGGTYKTTVAAGSAANIAFEGTGIDLIGIKAPFLGIANVILDGGEPIPVDQYGAVQNHRQVLWSVRNLPYGRHTVRVEYTGTKNPASTTARVSLDAYDVTGHLGLRRYADSDTNLAYTGTWATNSYAGALDNSYRTTITSGTAAHIAFSGKRIDLLGIKAPFLGIANVIIDDGAPIPVDFYNATQLDRQVIWSSGTLTDGPHTLRIVCTGTKNPAASSVRVNLDGLDVVGEMRESDKVAPVTVDDAPTGWSKDDVSVRLTATDALSAVATTYYKLNGATPAVYTTPILVTESGLNSIEYWSVDSRGNVEQSRSTSVQIDKSAPVVNINAPSGWVGSPAMVTLDALDSQSGPDTILYSLDASAPSIAYEGELAISLEGTTTLKVVGIDQVGNSSEITQTTVFVDDTAPETHTSAPAEWVGGPAMVSLVASDCVSGVAATFYSLDGSEPTVPYTGPVVVAAEGVHTLRYRSVDVKGNSEKINSATVKIDDSAPVTTDDAPAGWVDGPVSVTLEATDTVSGLELTEYRLNGGAWSTYDAPVQISAEGTTTLEYRSVDVKGNSEQINTATVRIDDSAPVTSDDAPAGWVNGPVSVTLEATDTVSGLELTEYRLDGGAWSAYDAPVQISAEGTTTLEYRSVDVKGNSENINSATVKIDDSAPVISDNAAARYFGSATVTLTVSDALSGVADTEYRINGGTWTSGTSLTIPETGIIVLEYRSTDVAGNVSDTTTREFVVVNRTENDAAMVSYTEAWTRNTLAGASGGTYQTTTANNATANISFNGRRIDLIGIKAPFLGIANVIVDGGAPVPVDCYNPTQLNNTVVWSSGELSDGPHTLRVEYTGTKNPAATNTRVSIDAFDIVGSAAMRRYEQDDILAAYYGSWSTNNLASASGTTYQTTIASGSSADIAFNGKRVDLIGIKAPFLGIANVIVDGGAPVPVDCYNTTQLNNTVLWSSGELTDGRHTVRVEYTGTKNPAASNTRVSIDAFDVVGYLTPLRYEQNSAWASYVGTWTENTYSDASGGTYKTTVAAGSAANIAFEGTGIDLIGIKAPFLGIANVILDGGEPIPVDQYGAVQNHRQVLWSVRNLPYGRHTVRVEYTGTKNPASTTARVSLDAYDVTGHLGLRRYADSDTNLAYTGTWATNSYAGALDNSYRTTITSGTAAHIAFSGKRIDLLGIKAPFLGIANVIIDDGAPIPVDFYNATQLDRQVIWSSGTLTDGPHTLRIVCTGTKNPAASSVRVNLDGLDVVGEMHQAIP